MLIVCMNWLCREYDIQARFVLSIHDELRYLVKEEDMYRCALALSLSNMYVRAAISQRLGILELPQVTQHLLLNPWFSRLHSLAKLISIRFFEKK